MRATIVVLAAVLACQPSDSAEARPGGGSAVAACSDPLRASGTLRTNVACPGFWDAVEGSYARHWVDGPVFAPRWPEGVPASVDSKGEDWACADDATVRFPGMAFTLTTRDQTPVRLLHVDVSDVVLTGDLQLFGSPDALCLPVPTSCGADRHDGGDGFCVPLGTCSPGHPIDANGLCSPFPRL